MNRICRKNAKTNHIEEKVNFNERGIDKMNRQSRNR